MDLPHRPMRQVGIRVLVNIIILVDHRLWDHEVKVVVISTEVVVEIEDIPTTTTIMIDNWVQGVKVLVIIFELIRVVVLVMVTIAGEGQWVVVQNRIIHHLQEVPLHVHHPCHHLHVDIRHRRILRYHHHIGRVVDHTLVRM